MKTTRLFCFVIGLLLAGSLMAQVNLVPNGGFEQDTWIDGSQPQEWIFNSGSNQTEFWTIGSEVGYENPTGVIPAEGTKMGYMKCLSATTYAWQTIKKPESNCVMINNGGNYIFSFKAYSILGPGNLATPKMTTLVEQKGGSWKAIDKTTYDIVPGAWRTFTVNFNMLDNNIPVGTTIDVSLGFIINNNELNTVFFIDDVKIVENEPNKIADTKLSKASLYPNPVISASKIINGSFNSAKAYNLTGMLVGNFVVDSNNEIDFSNLAAGSYMIKLIGQTEEIIKVIKK